MKKKAVAVVMTAVMALGMVSAVSVQAGIEDKTLIVGFDAEYPPYGYMDENGEYVGFDWNWHRLCVIWKVGSWRKNQSTGIPRIWN